MNGMTCREFDEVVHGFVRMELLDMSVREAVIEHAAHCDNCAVRMGEAGVLALENEVVLIEADNTPGMLANCRAFTGVGDGSSALSVWFECHTQSRSLAIALRDRPVATLSGLSATMASPLRGTASSSHSLISSQFSRRLPAALPPIRTNAQLPRSFSPCSVNLSKPLR